MINIALQFIIAGTLNGLAGFRVKGERLRFLELSAEVSLAVVMLEILVVVFGMLAQVGYGRVLKQHCWQERDAFNAGMAFVGAVGSVLVWFFVGGVLLFVHFRWGV